MAEFAGKHVGGLALYPSSRETAWDSFDWSLVDPAVRQVSFFSAKVEDAHVLGALQKMVEQAMREGVSVQEFIRRAYLMLDEIRLHPPEDGQARQKQRESVDVLYNSNRLRLIFRTQEALAAGYRTFLEAFEPWRLRMQPGWKFYRQPGAKIKRQDHVDNQGKIRLKTDWEWWLDRNSPDFGGFGNPYPPFGFNSWMRVKGVSRELCERIGLLRPGEEVEVPWELAQWNLPSAIEAMGRASVKGMEEDIIDGIVKECAEDGVQVARAGDELHVVPGDGDGLSELNDAFIDQLVQDELDALNEKSDEDILREALGDDYDKLMAG